MLNFIIAMLAHKGILEEEEAKKIAKSLFGRPLPGEYESMVTFVERLVKEAERSLERKYFDPTEFEKKEKLAAKTDAAPLVKEDSKVVADKTSKKTVAKKK